MRGPGSEPKPAPAGEDSNRAAGDALQSGGGVSSRSRLYPAAAGRKRAHFPRPWRRLSHRLTLYWTCRTELQVVQSTGPWPLNRLEAAATEHAGSGRQLWSRWYWSDMQAIIFTEVKSWFKKIKIKKTRKTKLGINSRSLNWKCSRFK